MSGQPGKAGNLMRIGPMTLNPDAQEVDKMQHMSILSTSINQNNI